MLRRPLALFSTALVSVALVVTGALPASAADVGDPFAPLRGFTVLTEHDAVTTASAHETEGSWAVGGDLVVEKSYILGGTHGAPLPSIDGTPTQLLVGGGVTLAVGGEAFQVNSGATRVEQTAGFTVSDGKRFRRSDDASRWLRMKDDGSVSTVAANGAWSTAFGDAFAALRATSNSIASMDAADAAILPLLGPSTVGGAADVDVQLVAGKVNILRVSAGQLAGVPNIWFRGGVVPSSATPFIIDVVDAGAVDLMAPVVRNIDERFVLWNLAAATSLNLRGWNDSEYIEGSILAPNAALEFLSGTIEGQVAVTSLRVSGGGEIHHIGFDAELPRRTEVAGSWSSTGACDERSNALTVVAVPGVQYTWTAGGPVGEVFASFDQAGLTGTWSFTVAVTDASSAVLTGPASHSVTFADPGTCAPPEPECIPASAVSYTYDPATNSGVVTVANPEGSTGELCRGFWVTATSWKFTGAGVWPQSLDQVHHVEAGPGEFFISKPGDYPYAATVECGQGDIYASYDAQPQPTPVLNGPNTPFEEHFLHDMGFAGPTPTYTVQSPGCNTVTPVAPVADPETCDALSVDGDLVAGGITLTGTAHVSYSIADAEGGIVATLAATSGQHRIALPAGAYTVTALPDAGWLLAGETTWELEVATPELPCLPTHADLPTGATWTDQVCTDGRVVDGTITVENFPGVSYLVDGVALPASAAASTTVTATPGTHLIEAIADDPEDTVTTATWTAEIRAASAPCGDLPTLALTGGSITGWALLGAVLALLGAVLASARRREPHGRHRAAD